MSKEKSISDQLSEEQISSCIDILNVLNTDTNQIFDIPEAQRLALIKAAGLLSRPSREEFQRRKKEAKKAQKRKLKEKDKHARNGTGIRSAREATIRLQVLHNVLCVQQVTFAQRVPRSQLGVRLAVTQQKAPTFAFSVRLEITAFKDPLFQFHAQPALTV